MCIKLKQIKNIFIKNILFCKIFHLNIENLKKNYRGNKKKYFQFIFLLSEYFFMLYHFYIKLMKNKSCLSSKLIYSKLKFIYFIYLFYIFYLNFGKYKWLFLQFCVFSRRNFRNYNLLFGDFKTIKVQEEKMFSIH